MKDQLQLKEIAGYLAFELKCQYEGILNGKALKEHSNSASCTLLDLGEFYRINPRPEEIKGFKIAPIKEIRIFNGYWRAYIGIYRIGLKAFINGIGFKPILRPMSDLTRPMLDEAGFECHIDYLTNEFNHWVTTYGIDHVINMLPYGHAQWLYRNHFDIHNLIGRGLAISIHDIPTK